MGTDACKGCDKQHQACQMGLSGRTGEQTSDWTLYSLWCFRPRDPRMPLRKSTTTGNHGFGPQGKGNSEGSGTRVGRRRDILGVGKLVASVQKRGQERQRELLAMDTWRQFEQEYMDEKPLLVSALVNGISTLQALVDSECLVYGIVLDRFVRRH